MGTAVQHNKTIDLLKVLLTVGIVFRHAELVGIAERNAAFGVFNQGMMLFTDLCVPMFFLLSGYLFFLNVPENPKLSLYFRKLRTRVMTLLIPYLIANAVAFAIYWLAHRYAPEMIAGFFGENWKHPLFIFWTGPINLSLWFIRDLMYSVLLSPLIYLLVRYTRFWGVLAVGVLWYFDLLPIYINFFFILGAWAAVRKIDVGSACRRTGWWFVLMYLCAFSAAMAIPSIWKLTIVAGLPLCIYAASLLMDRFHWNIPAHWPAWCFFMYLYHYIPEIVFKKSLEQYFNPNGFWSLMLVFLAVSILTLVALTGLYWLMKKWTPRTLSVLIGGKL